MSRNQPPVAQKKDHSYELHGNIHHDPYFWLRDKENPEVITYLEQENEYTKTVMKHTEDLQHDLFEELKNRIKEDDESVPEKIDDYYYYWRTEKGKNYKIYARKYQSLDADEEIFLDGNKLAEGLNFFRIGTYEISSDHKYVAYTTDTSGYETYNVFIKEIETGEFLEDRIEGVSGNLEWNADDDGLFYGLLDDIHRSYAVAYHRIGDDRVDDQILYEEKNTSFSAYFYRTRDKKILFIQSHGEETDEIRYIKLDGDNLTPQLFRERQEKVEFNIDHHDGDFYFLTSLDAINFKLCRTPVGRNSEENWETIIEHDEKIRLHTIDTFYEFMALSKRENGFREIEIIRYETYNRHQIDLPGEIYATYVTQNHVYRTDKLRFVFTSLVDPTTTYDYNINDQVLDMKKQEEVKGHNPEDYTTERIFVEARDGTNIPASIAYRKGITHPAPLLLYGYGSYGFAIDPTFSSNRISLLERDVIFVIAHIRGGGEMGKQWYHNGKMEKKMNTFNDFIDVAEDLIKRGFTTSEQLAIQGGSAGGLLMGAVVNLRPDLFKVVVAQVPFVDVINTMLDETIPLTTFEWKEWGNPKNADEFSSMYEYSPYDQTKSQDYPDMLITGGLNDPRVHFWEPAKWTAKLRDLKTDNNRLILKMNMGAGHSGASGRYDYMKEIAFIYAYLLDTLELVLV